MKTTKKLQIVNKIASTRNEINGYDELRGYHNQALQGQYGKDKHLATAIGLYDDVYNRTEYLRQSPSNCSPSGQLNV